MNLQTALMLLITVLLLSPLPGVLRRRRAARPRPATVSGRRPLASRPPRGVHTRRNPRPAPALPEPGGRAGVFDITPHVVVRPAPVARPAPAENADGFDTAGDEIRGDIPGHLHDGGISDEVRTAWSPPPREAGPPRLHGSSSVRVISPAGSDVRSAGRHRGGSERVITGAVNPRPGRHRATVAPTYLSAAVWGGVSAPVEESVQELNETEAAEEPEPTSAEKPVPAPAGTTPVITIGRITFPLVSRKIAAIRAMLIRGVKRGRIAGCPRGPPHL